MHDAGEAMIVSVAESSLSMTLHACMQVRACLAQQVAPAAAPPEVAQSLATEETKVRASQLQSCPILYQIPSEPCQVYPCSTLGAKGRPIHTTVACRLQVGILMSWHSNVLQQGCLMTPKTARGYTLAAP